MLHVLVTDDTAIEHYEKLLEKYEDNVIVEVAEYSYSTLYAETEAYVECLKGKYDIPSYGVDVKENKGKIRILSSDYEKVMGEITSKSTYGTRCIEDMFVFEEQDAYMENHASIVAGVPLSILSATLTLGGSGVYNHATAFVTCGHGLSEGLDVYYGNSVIGSVAEHQYENNKYGDYSIITASSGYTPSASVLTTGGIEQ